MRPPERNQAKLRVPRLDLIIHSCCTSSAADLLLAILGAEELLAVLDRRLDRPRTLVPVGGADFAVGFDELQGLDHSQGFIHAPAQRQVVDDLMPDDAGLVDQEQAPQGDSGHQARHRKTC